MKLLQGFHENHVFLLATWIVGFLQSSLCIIVNLDEEHESNLRSFVGSNKFLHQFAILEQIDPSVFDSGFEISVRECLRIVKDGYPQYVASCEITIAQQHAKDRQTSTSLGSKNTATVFIAENEILENERETVKKSSKSKWYLIPFSKLFRKGKKAKNNETTEKEPKGKAKTEDKYELLPTSKGTIFTSEESAEENSNEKEPTSSKFKLLTSSNDEEPTDQIGSSTITAKIQIREVKKKQKRIFTISNMVWDPVFKTGLALATALANEHLFGKGLSKDLLKTISRKFQKWVKSGMADLEKCPAKILAEIETAVRDRTRFGNFQFSAINHFVGSKTPKLHVVTLEAKCNEFNHETYYIGAILLSSKGEKSKEFNGKIFLTNYFKPTYPSEEEITLSQNADKLELPLTNWSMKQDSVPELREKTIGIFSKLTTISHSACVTYAVTTAMNLGEPYNLVGYMELRDKWNKREIVQVLQPLELQNRSEVFINAQNASESFPNWVYKTEPHIVTYVGLQAEFDRIKKDHIEALSDFRHKNCSEIKFEIELLTEATITNTGSAGSANYKIVVHALHLYYKEKWYETKYSLAEESERGTIVVDILYDPASWYKRDLTEWRTILLQAVEPIETQVVWWTHYPELGEPKNLMDKVKKDLKGSVFEKYYAMEDPTNGRQTDMRMFYGFLKHTNKNRRDTFVIYYFGRDIMNPVDPHYRFLQLTFELSPFRLLSTNRNTKYKYETIELAKNAVEKMLLQNN